MSRPSASPLEEPYDRSPEDKVGDDNPPANASRPPSSRRDASDQGTRTDLSSTTSTNRSAPSVNAVLLSSKDGHTLPTSMPPPQEQHDRQLASPPAPATDPQLARLQSQIQTLESQIASTTTALNTATSQLHSLDANATVQTHIKLLHRYNETKDIGMGLLGLISEQRGVRLKEVLEEWGVDERD